MKINNLLEKTRKNKKIQMNYIDKTKEELITDLQALQMKYNSITELYNKNRTLNNQAENITKISETRNTGILRVLPDMIFIQNKEGVYFDFYLPENAAKFVPQKVFIGQRIQNVLPESIVREFKPIFEKALETRQVQYLEYELNMPDEIHYFDSRLIAIEDDKILSIVRDVTSEKKAEKELLESNEKYRTLVENTNEALYVLQDGIFKYANKMCCEILNVPDSTMIGMSMLEFINPEDRDKALTQHMKIMKGELGTSRKNFRIITRNGKELCADVNSVVIQWGGKIATLNFAIDITERKLAETRLQLKNKELLIANSEKDKFFSIIAHDLRNPFNSFLGLTRLMVEDLPSMRLDEIQKMALTMRRSATDLSGLLENLLEWSCSQQGLLGYEPELLMLRSRIEDEMQPIMETAQSKGIEISLDINEDLVIYADSNMFGSIIRNLSGNAAKFTPKGGKISVSAIITDDRNIEISIIDSGIGMSPSMLERLFQIDSQINRKGTENEPSTGLGLYLCKDFVEKHGGKIWAKSAEEIGSVFYFTLPSRKN
jgi:PAS domain S-box-containing protein